MISEILAATLGVTCASPNSQTLFNFQPPWMSRTQHAFVLIVDGYDGYYLDSKNPRDLSTRGNIQEHKFSVAIMGPSTPLAAKDDTVLGSLVGAQDNQGQWHVTFTSAYPGTTKVAETLDCKE